MLRFNVFPFCDDKLSIGNFTLPKFCDKCARYIITFRFC